MAISLYEKTWEVLFEDPLLSRLQRKGLSATRTASVGSMHARA